MCNASSVAIRRYFRLGSEPTAAAELSAPADSNAVEVSRNFLRFISLFHPHRQTLTGHRFKTCREHMRDSFGFSDFPFAGELSYSQRALVWNPILTGRHRIHMLPEASR